MSHACAKCGCTEERACLEFDHRGIAHACWWATLDECSACFFPGLPPHLRKDTRARRKGKVISAPALAGMVARPR